MSKPPKIESIEPRGKTHRIVRSHGSSSWQTPFIQCSCGWKSNYNLFRRDKDRSQTEDVSWQFNRHKAREQWGIAQTYFVARIEKQKTTHEIWIMHSETLIFTDVKRRPRGWNVILHRPDATKWKWKVLSFGHLTPKEAALAAAAYVEKEKYYGNTIRHPRFFRSPEKIQKPMADFSYYLQQLVDKTKEVETIPEALALQEEIDHVEALMDAVKSARTQMNQRVMSI